MSQRTQEDRDRDLALGRELERKDDRIAKLEATLRIYVEDGACPGCRRPGECVEKINCAWQKARDLIND